MLISMTGHGAAANSNDHFEVSVELRTVNHRHFKANYRLPDCAHHLESGIERILKAHIRRGSLQLNVRLTPISTVHTTTIDTKQLDSLISQLIAAQLINSADEAPLASLLQMPGVLVTNQPNNTNDIDELLLDTISEAAGMLHKMRCTEGDNTKVDLLQLLADLRETLSVVTEHAPKVTASHQAKLLERVNRLINDSTIELNLDSPELIREIAIYADKCDITEEITRLNSHLGQFESECSSAPGSGRKLDFLVQEIFRETNTIGSKANNDKIAHAVVSMKANIERIREIIQNVE
jgi:uncharacterized protein (TIGR00255 family)